VLRQGSLPVGIGLICGIGGAFVMTQYLKSLLYEISTTDPLVFSSILAALILVALLAMSIPAHRATRVDPLEALRDE
jgi:putative ABC transport system permease protein